MITFVEFTRKVQIFIFQVKLIIIVLGVLQMSGYNDRMPVLTEALCQAIRRPELKQEAFEVAKIILCRELKIMANNQYVPKWFYLFSLFAQTAISTGDATA